MTVSVGWSSPVVDVSPQTAIVRGREVLDRSAFPCRDTGSVWSEA